MRKALKWLAFLALAAVLLYFSFKEVKWSDFIAGLQSCNWWWIVASMCIGIAGFLARALRWRLLMLPINKDITVREAFDGVNIGYITNFIFPRAGEVARCGVLGNTKKISFQSALGTVVLERSFDMICLMFWIAVLLVFKWNEFGSFMQKEIWIPLQEKFSSAVWILAIMGAAFVAALAAIWFLRKKLLQMAFVQKLVGILKGLWEGLVAAFKMKDKWLFLLYTLLVWLTYWLTSLTTIYAFPQVADLNGSDALFLMIVGGLGWVVPVQGGLGAYHFIVSLALASVYGIAQTTGVVFATISHEAQALVMILCGVVSFISITQKKRKNDS